MFKEENIKKLPDKFADIVNKLEKEVIDDIVKRLAESKSITRVIDWELYRINQLRTYDHDLRKLIQETLELEDETMKSLYDEIIEKGYAADAELYSKTGIPFVPYEENAELQQFVEAIKVQTQGSMENVTKTSGFVTSGGEFVQRNEYFWRMLDKTVLEAHSGVFNYEDTLRRTVNELANSGLRTVEYESGKRERIDVAVRRAVMTGLHQITAHISEKNAEALGTEYFEVSAHSTARPSHAEWQGKVYSLSELHSVCGLGDILGLCGINCYHHYDPFIQGISKRKYNDEELKKIANKNQEKKEFKGRKYTLYEATQRQRELERRMRAQDRKISLLKLGKSGKEEATILKIRRRATYEEYKELSEKFCLQEQAKRVFTKSEIFKNNEHIIGKIKKEYKGIFEGIKTLEVTLPRRTLLHIQNDHPERILEQNLIENVINSPDIIAKDEKWIDENSKRKNTYVFIKGIEENKPLGIYVKVETDIQKINNGYKNWVVTFFRTKKSKLLKKYGVKNLIIRDE